MGCLQSVKKEYDPTTGDVIQEDAVNKALSQEVVFQDQKFLTGCRDCHNKKGLMSYAKSKKSHTAKKILKKTQVLGELMEEQLADFKEHGEDRQPSEFTKNLNARFKKISGIFKQFGKDVEMDQEIIEPLAAAYKQIAKAVGPKI